ncbi:MAG: hypothetical protein F7C08_03215 [Desulfurococcales archaeon]|nr:hypothetical protein [Desulfurococcales archaeon]MCE4605522.1 hypothetical protein [Desulfurococcales archaeon]
MERRVTIRTPAILLGVPIPGSENPYLAAPTGSATYSVSVEDCNRPELRAEDLVYSRSLRELWISTLRGMGLGACASIRLDYSEGVSTKAGLYASASIALLYSLSKHYGETLSSMELVELARYGDPHYTGEWGYVLDALRYSAAEGGLVAYRNDEEHYTISRDVDARIELQGSKDLGEPRVTKESLGSDVYSAIIHTMGVTVLEASLRLNEGASLVKVLGDLAPVHEGVMMIVWGTGEAGRCISSPSMPRSVEVICLEVQERSG